MHHGVGAYFPPIFDDCIRCLSDVRKNQWIPNFLLLHWHHSQRDDALHEIQLYINEGQSFLYNNHTIRPGGVSCDRCLCQIQGCDPDRRKESGESESIK